jgi:hypothetical protein
MQPDPATPAMPAAGGGRTDWNAWHQDYADPGSALSARLAIVRSAIRRALADHADGQAEALTVLSACAGDGRDILGVLAEQGERVRSLDRAERFCRDNGLGRVRLRNSDAGLSNSYLGAAPADLVLMCGVFGNLSDADVRRLVAFLPQLCRAGARLIWTRSRRAPDLTPAIRDWLAAARFTELSFSTPPDVLGSVGVHRFDGEPPPLAPDQRLFDFIR